MEHEGRELNAPPVEAPRRALQRSTPSRAQWGACSVGSLLECSRFSTEIRSHSYAKMFRFVLHGCSLKGIRNRKRLVGQRSTARWESRMFRAQQESGGGLQTASLTALAENPKGE